MPDTEERPPARGRGRMFALFLVVALAGAGLAAVVTRNHASGDTLSIASAKPFDPNGSGPPGENDDLAPKAIDGDNATAWETEPYRNPDLTKGKGGVGLTVVLHSKADVSTVRVTSLDGGWAASVYVHDGDPPADLAGWGDAVGSTTGAKPGSTDIDLTGASGDHVLVWFTQLPASGVMHVSEVAVKGHS